MVDLYTSKTCFVVLQGVKRVLYSGNNDTRCSCAPLLIQCTFKFNLFTVSISFSNTFLITKHGVQVHFYSYNVQLQNQAIVSTSTRFLCTLMAKLLDT